MLKAVVVALLAAGSQQAWPSHAREVPARAAAHVVATVNGVSLKSDRLDAAMRELLPFESFHQNIKPERVAELRQQALTRLVDDELAYQEGTRLGVKVAPADVEKELDALVARYPSRQAFLQALAEGGASLDSARAELKRSLVIRRTFDRQVQARCVVGRAEAQRFFDEHPERFVEPEQLHVQAITIGVEPSAGAEAWAAARARADEMRAKLLDGADFAAAARQYSTDDTKDKGGDMGYIHRGSLSEAFEKAAADLPLGRPSAVVETIYGYHVIRVTDVRPPKARGFADVGAKLQTDLTASSCEAANKTWRASLRAAAHLEYPE